MSKFTMPKRKAEYEEMLILTFMAGCDYGYGVLHEIDIEKQERLGAEHWIGRISDEEYEKRRDEILGGGE